MTGALHATPGVVAALIDELVRAGISDAVISPGSRSTPLALSAAARLRTHVFVDERSAAFFALGYGKESGRAPVLICTSGTAAANYLPAVKEADLSRVPMLICTADRPPELRDTGAPQTMDQQHLYGGAVRWYAELGPADEDAAAPAASSTARLWRSVGARAAAITNGPVPGPVHLNLPFREPFVTSVPPSVPPGRADGQPWTEAVVASDATEPVAERLVAAVGSIGRGVVLVGQDPGADRAAVERFAAAAGWPVLADPLSGMRLPGTITTYDALVRSSAWAEAMQPEAVLRLGRPLTSKALTAWLGSVTPHLSLAPTPSWADPHRAATLTLAGDPTAVLGVATEALEPSGGDWLLRWDAAEQTAREAMDAALDSLSGLSEPRIARDVVAALPDGARLQVASSMPVRDVESFAAGRDGLVVRSNRGVNGIDGTVSTTLGMAAAAAAPTAALLGDLAFLHDANGLLGAVRRGLDVTFVVVDNNGGGIFSFLPQASHARFEELFGTPHDIDVGALARVHGLEVETPTAPEQVAPAVAAAIDGGGIRLVHLRTERKTNVVGHDAVWRAVASALAP